MPNKRKYQNKSKSTVSKQIEYPGGLKFDDFKNLCEIEGDTKTPIYLLFDPNLIKDYDKISDADLKAFGSIAASPQFCGPYGQVGIKYFSGIKPKCRVEVKQDYINTDITHEFKIKVSDNRIVLFELKPTKDGPTILVAAQYVEGGLHNSRDSKKTYCGKLPSVAEALCEDQKVSVGNNRFTLFKPEHSVATKQQEQVHSVKRFGK